MKLIIVIILLFGLRSQAWNIAEVVARDPQNQLVRSYQAQCQNGESFCQELCGVASQCQISRDTCEACVSDTDLVTRSIILDSNRVYQVKKEIVQSDSLVNYLKSSSFYLMSATSLVNVYSDPQNPTDEESLRVDLRSICLAPTENPLVILDGTSPKDWAPVAIVCDDFNHNSVVMPLELKPEFSNDDSSLHQMKWQTQDAATQFEDIVP